MSWSIKVQSLHRLYNKDPKGVTIEELDRMKDEAKITQAEYDYIISPM